MDGTVTRVGIVGHRYFNDRSTGEFIYQQSYQFLRQLKLIDPTLITISAIAEGADTLFAEAAIKLDLPLEIVRPFRKYIDDFQSEGASKRYCHLKAAARNEKILPYETRSVNAYEAAMRWVVLRADLLFAVWDGLPPRGRGGTGHAVRQAIKCNRPWIHLNSREKSITYHW